MEYTRIVQTVVETPTYLAIANELFSEAERADIVALVAADPECGDLIRGTGGTVKVHTSVVKGISQNEGIGVDGTNEVRVWYEILRKQTRHQAGQDRAR